jgi:hypothetical protein
MGVGEQRAFPRGSNAEDEINKYNCVKKVQIHVCYVQNVAIQLIRVANQRRSQKRARHHRRDQHLCSAKALLVCLAAESLCILPLLS